MKPYYDQDGITIYHGDCLEVLPHLGQFDMVFTSPPYNRGMRLSKGWIGPPTATAKMGKFKNGYGEHDDAMPLEEYEDWQVQCLQAMWERLTPVGAIFYNHRPRIMDGALWTPLSLNTGLPLRQVVIWSSGPGVNIMPGAFAGAHEWVVIYAQRKFRLKDAAASARGDVWAIPPAVSSDHPAPFPLGLPARAIDAAAPSSVLDPFMGTGTTLRAAKDAGIRAVGIELSERYCELAVKRLAQGALIWA